MNLFEYQGKELFRRYEVPVPKSILVTDPSEVSNAISSLTQPLVLKIQVRTGGRGKLGGVVLAKSGEEAERRAEDLFVMRVNGERPRALLIEEAISHDTELFLSIALDRGRRAFVVVAAGSGGVDVESLPGKVIEPISAEGLDQSLPALIASRLNLSGRTCDQFVHILRQLEALSREQDCELVEINPLAVASDGDLVALDSKVVLDDNAMFRHPEYSKFTSDDPLEREAARNGFAFVRLPGDISVIGNGAGLVLSTLDLLADAGGRAACFLDLGGGSQRERVEAALHVVRELPNSRKVLVNVFGGITRTTDVAAALKQLVVNEGFAQPVFARISGAEEKEAREMLQSTSIKMFSTAMDAIEAVVRAR